MDNISYLKNLKLLWALRNIAIVGHAIAITVVTKILDIPLFEKPLWGIISLLVVVNIATWARIKRAGNISEFEFFCQLLIDITVLFGLLYLTGGATNPFAQLFILQVIIAAITLSPFYTWIIASITIALYTSIMLWNVEVPYFMHHHMGDFFSLHVQGMWINFILLAGIISWFVVRMNITIKRQDSILAEAEKMAAIGRLASSAAHELGEPLAKLSAIAKDFDKDISKIERKKKGDIFLKQFGNIEHILSTITEAGKTLHEKNSSIMPLDKFLKETIKSFNNMEQPQIDNTLTLFDAEREYIFAALKRNNNNISATARELAMHRRTLQRKLDKIR
jgi:two-component system sensor histidine kinase RegB